MRKVLGVLLILISTIVGVVVLLGWGIRTSLLSSAPWKAGLRETRVYDRLLVEALPEIVAEKMVTDNVLEKAPLTPNDLVAIAQGTLSASFLQQQLERGLDVAFDLLHSRTSLSTTNFIIPLQDVKRQLPIAAQERLVARVQALPICVADQLKDFEKFKSLTDALPPCRPKGLDVAAIVRDSLKIDEITANIPATYDVVVELQKQRTADSNVKTPAQQIVAVQEQAKFIFQIHWYLTLAWIVLLLGLGALFIPHWRRVVQWFAVGLFIPSMLLIVGTLIGKGMLPNHFTVSDRSAQVLANIAQPVAASLVHTVSLHMFMYSGAAAALAVILFTLAYSFAHRRLKS
ncbi:MAG: hypothetical protein AAB424_02755 [Patescibacteria group bacterium]